MTLLSAVTHGVAGDVSFDDAFINEADVMALPVIEMTDNSYRARTAFAQYHKEMGEAAGRIIDWNYLRDKPKDLQNKAAAAALNAANIAFAEICDALSPVRTMRVRQISERATKIIEKQIALQRQGTATSPSYAPANDKYEI